MADVDRREAVQVMAAVFCPPDRQQGSSVLLVVLPLAQDRGMVIVFSVLLSWHRNWESPCFSPLE